MKTKLLFLSLTAAGTLCSPSFAQQISGDLYWKYDDANRKFDTKQIYEYEGRQLTGADDVNWAECNLIFDGKVNGIDNMNGPATAGFTVKNITISNFHNADSGGHFWWSTGSNNDMTITEDLTINTNLSGPFNNDYGVTVGRNVNVNEIASSSYTGEQYVGLGADVYSAHDHNGWKFLKVGGDFNMTGKMRVAANFVGSLDDPNFVVEGTMNMTATAKGSPTFDMQFQGEAANRFYQIGGLSGTGRLQGSLIHQTASGLEGTLVFANKAGVNTEFVGVLGQGDINGTDKAVTMNILKKGLGTQTLRATGGETGTLTRDTWEGTMTVREGKMLVNFDDRTKYALVLDGGEFGVVGANAGEDIGSMSVESFDWQSGVLLVNNAGTSSMSVLNVKGALTLGAFADLAIRFDGSLGEGDIVALDDFLKFDGASDKAAMEGALASGEMSVFVGDQQHNYSYDSATGLTIMEVVPEPAAVAAVLGALALGLALCRRRG